MHFVSFLGLIDYILFNELGLSYMCVYQNIIYFCKTAFGTLIGGNVLTSHGINKA